jgi:hypothetical protein
MMNSDQYRSWSCVSCGTSALDSCQTTHNVKNSCGGYSEKPYGTVYHKPRVRPGIVFQVSSFIHTTGINLMSGLYVMI